MKLLGSSLGAVLRGLLFGRYTSTVQNANSQPADQDIYQKLSCAAQQPLRYWGPISQSSTSNPTFGTAILNQLTNSSGVITAPTLARTGTGVYTLTLAGAFAGTMRTIDQPLAPAGAVTGRVKVEKTTDDVVTISTFNTSNAATDALLTAYQLVLEIIPTV